MNKSIPLVCPCKTKSSLKRIKNYLICKNKNCQHNKKKDSFKILNSKPVIISEIKTDTVCSIESHKPYVHRQLNKLTKINKIIIGESSTTLRNCDLFIKNIFMQNKNPKILVIGGAEKGSGTKNLWNNKDIEIHSIDIYDTDNVDVICDSHYLCLKSNFYDGVWIQAVLEHVVEPAKVVNEIFRVLRLKGIVYAETPFMQQVHEGAYDFTRFTVLGHRYLFKKFELIEFGGNQGPDVVLAWGVKYLVWSLSRSKKLARIFYFLMSFLMRPLKYFISKKSLFDGSSGVFFLGRKNKSFQLSHKELIRLYKGQF